jgi:hypothetical protein
MRHLLVHASTKSRSAAPRRVLHIEYADGPELDSGCVLAAVWLHRPASFVLPSSSF